VFDSDQGIVLSYVLRERVDDFERVVDRVRGLLSESDNVSQQDMAAGWRMFRAREPGPSNSVVYVWVLEPVTKGADHGIPQLLRVLLPPVEANDLTRRYSESLAGPSGFGLHQRALNLDEVATY
jgi:hypothetical protein